MMIQRTRSAGSANAVAIAGNAMFIMESSDTTSAPAAALGTVLYAGVPAEWLGRFVGVFLIASVPIRRVLATDLFHMRLRHFPLLGAFIGLLRSAFVGTEAVCAMAMHLARGAALARYALLTWDMVVVGTVLGGTMFAGAWLGRRMLDHMSDRVFLGIIEVLLVAMGLQSLLFP